MTPIDWRPRPRSGFFPSLLGFVLVLVVVGEVLLLTGVV